MDILPKVLQGKNIIIFGAGYWGTEIAKTNKLKIDFYVDNNENRAGEYIQQYKIYPISKLNEVDKKKYHIVIANVNNDREIQQQLLMLGWEEKQFTDFRYIFENFNQLLGVKKTVIKSLRYNVTNRCNSRCMTCNCWQNKEPELSLEQYRKAVLDPMLKNVESLYITGGEPYILSNFTEYIRASIENLPNLRYIYTVTNGLLVERIVEETQKIISLCEKNQISLGIAVSIDGTEEINDKIRGVKGDYKKVLRLMEKFKEAGIPRTTSTTISKMNVWHLEELLLELNLMEVEQVYKVGLKEIFFNNFESEILDYDDDEVYQMKLFFYKLAQKYKTTDWMYAICINSIQALDKSRRILGCQYKDGNALAIMQNGNLKYCGCVSDEIQVESSNSLEKVYRDNEKYFDFIKHNICENCMADAFSYPNENIQNIIDEMNYWQEFYTIHNYLKMKDNGHIMKHIQREKHEEESVLITGWYGTETVGDKAILGDIIEKYEKMGFKKVKVTSMYPFVTEQTLKELKKDVEIVPFYNRQALIEAMSAAYLVIGGGPLMEIEQLGHLLWLSNLSKRSAKKIIIERCGIGPIRSEEKKQAVVELLQMADEIRLRDAKSCEWALKEAGVEAELVDDPAVNYLKNHFNKVEKQKAKKGILACFLREMTTEYNPGMAPNDFEYWVENFEQHLASNIKRYCDEHQLTPHFYSMHNFVIGNDDRDFNFRFTRKYFSDRDYFVDNKLTSIDTVVNHMQEASKVLCMRFHSVVFADTLGADYMAIDYTSGGKIKSFMENKGKDVYSIDEIINEKPFV